MASVNKVIILGNICKDPEVRFMPSGDAMVNLSVATNEQWKDKTTGEKQERAEFHRIAIFGKLAEIAGEYLKKGSSAYFEGKLQTRKWTTKEGNDQYTTEIIADKMQMLGGKKDADAGDSKPSCGASQSSSWQSHGDDLDSDIPFNREEA